MKTQMMSLQKIYECLLRQSITPKEGGEILKDYRKLIQMYINKDVINPSVPYTDEDLQNIYMIIQICQFIYNNSGESTSISDIEYDKLYSIMLANGGNDVVSAPILESSDVVTHKYPDLRGSLDKVYYLSESEKRTNPSRMYLDEWIRRAETKLEKLSGKRYNLNEEEVYVFPKWDGVSCILEFDKYSNLQRALTRGDVSTNEACDITDKLTYYDYPKWECVSEYGVKTEIMMKEEDLEKYNKEYHCNYKNTRSIVASILNSKELDERVKYLVVQELRIQLKGNREKLSTKVFSQPFINCKLSEREKIKKFANEHAYVDGLRCDGAVIHIINKEIQELLGREDNINKYEVAYKFTEEVQFSKIKDIEFQLGLFGVVTPIAKIQKVKMKGNTIKSISLGSMGRFNELQLAKGDTIKVLYDIIPYLVFDDECERSNNKPFNAPTKCPECGAPLKESESGQTVSCVNNKCPCRMKGKILHYLSKMNINNISYGVVDKFYELGVLTSIEDIYNLRSHRFKLESVEGFGIVSVNNILTEIDTHKNVTDYQMLGAIGIENIGERIFKKIMEVYDINELIKICKNQSIDKLVSIKGVQEKTALKIINGILNNLDTIKFLMKELDLIKYKYSVKELTRFKICFTKVRDKKLEKEIEDRQGTVVDSVTKDVSLVVIPSNDIGSSKLDKAKKYGIPIVTIDKAKEYIDTMFKNQSK